VQKVKGYLNFMCGYTCELLVYGDIDSNVGNVIVSLFSIMVGWLEFSPQCGENLQKELIA